MKNAIMISAVPATGIPGYIFWPVVEFVQSTASQTTTQGTVLVDIVLPETLSTNAQIGQRGIEANCAASHGLNGGGQQGVAPPLVYVIYEPDRHSDESFQRAVALGVKSHHWTFGSMPPVEGLTGADIAMIIQDVHELQRANGIN